MVSFLCAGIVGAGCGGSGHPPSDGGADRPAGELSSCSPQSQGSSSCPCADGGCVDGPTTEVHVEASAETSVDSSAETSVDSSAETSVDSSKETGVEASPDAAGDGVSDAALDTSCDVGCTRSATHTFCTASEVQWECHGANRSAAFAACRDPATDLPRFCCAPSFLSTCR
jgi:hypothetical protein